MDSNIEMEVSGTYYGPVSSSTSITQQVTTVEPTTPVKEMKSNRAGSEKRPGDQINISSDAAKLSSLTAQGNTPGVGKRARPDREQTISAISKQLDMMQESLMKIRKNYPPFPLDSRERENLLKTANALRKEIDRMTIPPPLDQLKYGDGSDGALMNGIAREMPGVMSNRATDQQVQVAMDKIDNVRKLIADQTD